MCMTLFIPQPQRYVDIIAFSIVIHVGFSITIIFILFLLQRTVLTAVLFLYNSGGYSLKKIELQSPIAVANFIIDVAKKGSE